MNSHSIRTLTAQLDAIAHADFSVTQVAQQRSFNTLRAVWRFRIAHAFIQGGTGIALADFEVLAHAIIDGGLQLGSVAYHAEAGSVLEDGRSLIPVDFGKLMEGLNDLEAGGDRAASFSIAVREFPPLPQFFRAIAERHFPPEFSEHREASFLMASFVEMVGTGFRAEFLVHHLATEQEEEEFGMARIVEVLAEIIDGDLNARLGAPVSGLPWPSNLKCVCGASLANSIYCCEPESPIPVDALPTNPAPDFVLTRACCGQTLPGFRCDRCARLYTWMKTPSHERDS